MLIKPTTLSSLSLCLHTTLSNNKPRASEAALQQRRIIYVYTCAHIHIILLHRRTLNQPLLVAKSEKARKQRLCSGCLIRTGWHPPSPFTIIRGGSLISFATYQRRNCSVMRPSQLISSPRSNWIGLQWLLYFIIKSPR